MRVLGGLGAVLGAGVFTAIAPAAAFSGRALPLGVLVATVLAMLAAVSRHGAGSPHNPWTRAFAALARIAAAAAVAGTAGEYLTPQRPLVGAISLLVVVLAAEYLVPEPPDWLRRLAAGAVVLVLVVFVVSCFALAAPPNQAVPDGLAGADSIGGALAAGAVLVVAFGGAEGRDRFAVLTATAVLLGCVAIAALYQLGGGRLAVSPVPLRDALATAAGTPIDGLLSFGVALGCALVLFDLPAGVRRAVPGHRLRGSAVLLLGACLLLALLTPVAVLAGCAAALLLCWIATHLDVLLRARTARRWRPVLAGLGLLGSAAALLTLLWQLLAG